MNNRHVIALFLVVFVLTVSFISWRDGTLPSIATRAREFSSAFTADPLRGPAQSSARDVPTGPASLAPPGSSPDSFDIIVTGEDKPLPPDDSPPPTDLDPTQSQVPVLLAVEIAPDQSRQSATLRNLGPESLNVKVTSVMPPSGRRSIVQVAIPPRTEISLTNAGLVVAQGAEISVESPPYLAQTTTVY